MNDLEQKSILQMARGAIAERADYEVTKVINNILDPNTPANKKRKLTLTLTFTPDAARETVTVACEAKSTLVATNPVQTMLYVAGENDIVELTAQTPGQLEMTGEVTETPAALKLVCGGR